MNQLAEKLECFYKKYNKYSYIHPDPLEFLYEYNEDKDRELIGILASALAYGRVAQILKSIKAIAEIAGNSIHAYITGSEERQFFNDLKLFKHRFTTGNDIALLFTAIKKILQQYESLKNYFAIIYNNSESFLDSVSIFTQSLTVNFSDGSSSLIPSPQNGSACKRMMLFLRWMIRKDEVDPGCWHGTIPTSELIIPLDTHMFNIATQLNFTKRKSPDMKTAIEITKAFSNLNFEDPTKYDFALTRFGIREEMSYTDLFDHINKNKS